MKCDLWGMEWYEDAETKAGFVLQPIKKIIGKKFISVAGTAI